MVHSAAPFPLQEITMHISSHGTSTRSVLQESVPIVRQNRPGAATTRPSSDGSDAAGDAASRETVRKIWHMAPGLIALLVPLIPHRDHISPIMGCAVMIATVAAVALFLARGQQLSRRGEQDYRARVLGYALPVAISIFLFPAKMELGLAVLAVLAFGDGAAALAGVRFPSRRLSWNADKTIAGFLAFLAAAVPAATWVWWAEARPGIPFATALALGIAGSIVAAFAETARSSINDNVRVGVAAAATFWIISRLAGLPA
jgi:dolichol kinase